MANRFFPEKKGGRIIVLLLLVLGIAAVLWHYHGVPPWAPHWLRVEHKTVAISAAVPQQKKMLPVIAPMAPTVSADKDCIQQQLKLLGSARADAVEKAKRLYARKAGGDEFVAYVASNLDGDPGKGPKGLETLGKHIEWNFTAKNGARFHLGDIRKVCICHAWDHSYVPPSVLKHPVIYRAPAVRESGCPEIDFNAYGPYVRWGVGSVDGPLMPSACNAQRQGPNGMFTAWYGICSDCIESTSVLEQILGAAAQIWHKFFYDVSNTEQTLRFGPDIKTKAVYICVTYSDGTVHTVFVRPEDWRGTNRIRINDPMWESPDGTDQKHLH